MSYRNSPTKGEQCCAVANCKQYSGNIHIDGSVISLHKFPTDLKIQKLWAERCKRDDEWNPEASFICSRHFTSDDFVIYPVEIFLGYSIKVREVKQDAIPILNLPADASSNKDEKILSTINGQNIMDAKLAKKVHDELATSSFVSTASIDEDTHLTTTDYEKLYNDLLNDNATLKIKNKKQEAELLSLKLSINNYVKINDRLKTSMSIIQNELGTTNELLKDIEKEVSKEINMPSLNTESEIISEDRNINEMEFLAAEYLAGWVAKKYISTMPEIVCTTTEFNKTKTLPGHDYKMPSWINHLSYGKLIIPSNYLKKIIFQTERLFNKFTNHQLPKGPNVAANLTKKMFSSMSVEEKFEKVIRTYIEERIILRVKYFNYNNQLLNE